MNNLSNLTIEQLKAEAEAMRGQLVATRRDFHMHPELAFQEVRTAGIVAQRLGELGYEVQTGVGKTGVVGVLEGNGSAGETLLLRFDMDALPIIEAVDVPFKSQNPGVMHACGHDAHTAIGLGVAELLARHRDQWGGVAKFVFQPAEEIIAGAKAMIQDGVLDNPKPTRALSMHVSSMEPVGTVQMTNGPTMAAAQAFSIKVTGRGAHGASPHQGRDPIVTAAHIITALQTVVSRNVEPLKAGVITIGAIHGGTVGNVIPDIVEMKGTIRSFEPEIESLLKKRMQAIIGGIAESMECSAVLEFDVNPTPATVNDPALAEQVRENAKALVGAANVRDDRRTMGAEDCAWFLQAAPGAYVFIGAGSSDESKHVPHHSPRFVIEEDSLPIATALVTKSALDFLK
ncbi:MAG: amidohydrolase [Anaerolineae bacterium]|nr:amidohydrolase [Anaerolineae bacterium]